MVCRIHYNSKSASDEWKKKRLGTSASPRNVKKTRSIKASPQLHFLPHPQGASPLVSFSRSLGEAVRVVKRPLPLLEAARPSLGVAASRTPGQRWANVFAHDEANAFGMTIVRYPCLR